MLNIPDPPYPSSPSGVGTEHVFVTDLDTAGHIINRHAGSHTADCTLYQVLSGLTGATDALKASEYYVFATLAQGAVDVALGAQPSFNRRSQCRAPSAHAPCTVQVEPQYIDGKRSGATVTCRRGGPSDASGQ
jgi:hypothetical protein